MSFYLIALGTFALDQLSKALIVRHFRPGQSIPILPGFFDLTFVLNPGAAFGFLAGLPERFRHPLFVGIAIAAAVLIVLYRHRHLRHQALASAALGLILGGAIGNLIDRLRYGMVVDFLDCYVGPYHWPAFNVADSAISIGVGLMLLDLVLEWRRERRDGRPNA
jgi:signal peptidase II